MIEADVGDDAVRPGIKAALETEARQIPVNFQESFLVDVAGIFRPVQNVQGDSQDIAVVAVDQFFKGFAVPGLGAFNQGALFGLGLGFCPATPNGEVEPPTGSPEPLPDEAIVISSAAMVTYSQCARITTLLLDALGSGKR